MNDFRWIEMKQKIINGGQEVLHRLWRLSNWVELNPDNLSLNVFEHTR